MQIEVESAYNQPGVNLGSRPHTPRINLGGNFCGHGSENFRWHCYQPPLKPLLIQKKTQSELKRPTATHCCYQEGYGRD